MEGSLVAYKVFTNGSVLNASEINDNLMNQSVMVFSNSAARDAALTAPVEGMLTWLQDSNKYQYRNGSSAWVDLGGGGAILQVVSTTKTDTFTLASTTFTEITGLTATITPTSATSKILVNVSVSNSSNLNSMAHFLRLMRGVTAIGIGDAAGSRIQATTLRMGAGGGTLGFASNFQFLDSPSSTSALTYSVQVRGENANTLGINRTVDDNDSNTHSRGISTITLMEVAV